MGAADANTVDGNINIINGNNCKVYVEVHGFGGSYGAMLWRNNAGTRSLYGEKLFAPKAITVAYPRNSKVNRRIMSFGQRQRGDNLLRRETKVIKIESGKEFAEDVFEYVNDRNFITYATFSSNVSKIH